jgi:hypothetical protein
MLAEGGAAIPPPSDREGERAHDDERNSGDEPGLRVDTSALDRDLARHSGECPRSRGTACCRG